MSAILGVDISKATFDCVLLVGKTVEYQQFPNTLDGFRMLEGWLTIQNVDTSHAAMEATGRYGNALALHLYCAGHTVSQVNPRYIKAFGDSLGTQHKTDKQDAHVIARFCKERSPEPWVPKSASIEQLQQQTRYLKTLKNNRQQERNRLKSGMTDAITMQSISKHIAFLQEQIVYMEKQIHQTIKSDPLLWHQYKLLLTIPAIGKTTAPVLLAEIGDIHRFEKVSHLISYAGLVPRLYQSGTSVNRQAHITKQGNSHLRTALYMPAVGSPRWNERCSRLHERLEKQGKSGKLIVVANMNLLLRVAYGVLKNQQPFDPDFLNNLEIAA